MFGANGTGSEEWLYILYYVEGTLVEKDVAKLAKIELSDER